MPLASIAYAQVGNAALESVLAGRVSVAADVQFLQGVRKLRDGPLQVVDAEVQEQHPIHFAEGIRESAGQSVAHHINRFDVAALAVDDCALPLAPV